MKSSEEVEAPATLRQSTVLRCALGVTAKTKALEKGRNGDCAGHLGVPSATHAPHSGPDVRTTHLLAGLTGQDLRDLPENDPNGPNY